MKHTKRILCTVLAMALLLTAMLTGCSMPKLTIGGTPAIAGTVAGRDIATGEYLAYLYETFSTMYYQNGLYYYEYYGTDPWTQEYTYGEGDNAQKMQLAEYIIAQTKDTIVRQAALESMLKEHNIAWIADEEKEIDESLATMDASTMLTMGFSKENYTKVYKSLYLNERSLFYGLYGKGGKREISEADQKKYFEENYLSYKMISIALTDDEGKELDEAGQKKITDQLNGYLEKYNQDKNFEAVMDEYNKANAEEGETVEATEDADNRKNVDAEATEMDEDLEEAVRSVEVGSAKVVTYKSGGSTPTAALIVRLDIHDPATLFTDSQEDIISAMKYEEFDEEVTAAAGKVAFSFNESAIEKCNPKNFIESDQ